MISMPVAKFTMNVLEITVRGWIWFFFFFFKYSRSFLKRQFSSNSKFHNHFYNLSKVSNFNLSQSKVKSTNCFTTLLQIVDMTNFYGISSGSTTNIVFFTYWLLPITLAVCNIVCCFSRFPLSNINLKHFINFGPFYVISPCFYYTPITIGHVSICENFGITRFIWWKRALRNVYNSTNAERGN